jgi:hypothetical protein
MPIKRYCVLCKQEHYINDVEQGPVSYFDDMNIEMDSDVMLFRRKDGYHYYQVLALEELVKDGTITEEAAVKIRLKLWGVLNKVLFFFPFESHVFPASGKKITCAESRKLQGYVVAREFMEPDS